MLASPRNSLPRAPKAVTEAWAPQNCGRFGELPGGPEGTSVAASSLRPARSGRAGGPKPRSDSRAKGACPTPGAAQGSERAHLQGLR